MSLIINDYLILKNEIQEKFGIVIHMKDTCGAQVFSLEKPITPEIKDFIENFLKEKNLELVIINETTFSAKN